MSLIDGIESLLSHIPGVSNAQAQVDAIRRQFLAIPATTQTARATLQRIRSMTNDASEVQKISALLMQADSVDSGFNLVTAQFAHFDELRRTGGSTTDLVAAAASLLANANSVLRQSNALAEGVTPFAKKYGQAVPPSASSSGGAAGVVLMLGAGALMLYAIRPKKRGRR